MKIERKEEVRGIRIVEHNKTLLWWIIALIVLLVGVLIYIKMNPSDVENNADNKEVNETLACVSDSDCVPEQVCHPTSCINLNYNKLNNFLCTQECMAGTLDCNQGSCKCMNNKCSAVITNEGGRNGTRS